MHLRVAKIREPLTKKVAGAYFFLWDIGTEDTLLELSISAQIHVFPLQPSQPMINCHEAGQIVFSVSRQF